MLGLGRQGLGCDGETLGTPCASLSPRVGGSGPRPAASGAPTPVDISHCSVSYLFSLHGGLAMVPGRGSL